MTLRTAVQYTALCRGCSALISLTRERIDSGRNPICDLCGDIMVVYSAAGGAQAHGEDAEKRLRLSEGQ